MLMIGSLTDSLIGNRQFFLQGGAQFNWAEVMNECVTVKGVVQPQLQQGAPAHKISPAGRVRLGPVLQSAGVWAAGSGPGLFQQSVSPCWFSSAGLSCGPFWPPVVPSVLSSLTTVSKFYKRVTTAAPTPLWNSNSAECPRPQFWVWRVRRDVLWGSSKGLVGPRTEAARLLMEAPHQRGMGEAGDQTREAD